ncbi:hypothetical protein HK102_005384 [Quaeritorhiza haematococci]|nr:hypothetical protein HK102_005384 [Quaeritorhiza haematococci]
MHLKRPDQNQSETGFAHLAPHLLGILAIDSMRRGLYVDSESDPYYQLMKRAVDSANTTFKLKESSPKLTFENVKPAFCLAFLIPALSKMIEKQEFFWESLAMGNMRHYITAFRVMLQLNELGLVGRANETWSWASEIPLPMSGDSKSMTARTPIYILNGLYQSSDYCAKNSEKLNFLLPFLCSFFEANNRTALDSGSFLKSFTTIGRMERLLNPELPDYFGGYQFINATFAQIAKNIIFPDGTSKAPRLTRLITDRQRSDTLSLAIFITTLILEGLFCLIFGGILVVRRSPSVQRTGLPVIAVIVGGCMLQLASALPGFFQNRDTPETCLARNWVHHVGFAITFSAIVLSLYKIYRLQTAQQEVRSKEDAEIADPVVWPYYVIIMLVFTVVLLIDTTVFGGASRLRGETQIIDDLTVEVWEICNTTVLAYILLGVELVILGIGTLFAVESMRMAVKDTRTQHLGLAVYNSLFILVVSFVVNAVLTPTFWETEHLIHFLRVSLTTTFIIAVVCVPKFLPEQASNGDSFIFAHSSNRNSAAAKKQSQYSSGKSSKPAPKVVSPLSGPTARETSVGNSYKSSQMGDGSLFSNHNANNNNKSEERALLMSEIELMKQRINRLSQRSKDLKKENEKLAKEIESKKEPVADTTELQIEDIDV